MSKNARTKRKPQPGKAKGAQLKLALGEFIRETLYETVLVAGFAYVREVLTQELAQVCGPRYRHAEERTAYRYGQVQSSLVLGGRRVSVGRPPSTSEL